MVALAAGLVVVLLGAGSRATPHAAAPAKVAAVTKVADVAKTTHAPNVTTMPGGSTCYVGAGQCSESPCVEFVRSADDAVLHVAVPNVSVPNQKTACAKRVLPGPSVVAVTARSAGVVSVSPARAPAARR